MHENDQLQDDFDLLVADSLQTSMIKIHLSRLMGEHKEKLADLIRSTGLARNTIAGLYRETTARIDLDTLNALCRHYDCSISELLEYVPDEEQSRAP